MTEGNAAWVPARGYPYAEYEGEMILRDHLAYDRTRFALLRTLLSVCRTALGLLASGAGLVILQTSAALVALGWALIAAAVATFSAGCTYSLRAKRRLDGLRRQHPSATASMMAFSSAQSDTLPVPVTGHRSDA